MKKSDENIIDCKCGENPTCYRCDGCGYYRVQKSRPVFSYKLQKHSEYMFREPKEVNVEVDSEFLKILKRRESKKSRTIAQVLRKLRKKKHKKK